MRYYIHIIIIVVLITLYENILFQSVCRDTNALIEYVYNVLVSAFLAQLH